MITTGPDFYLASLDLTQLRPAALWYPNRKSRPKEQASRVLEIALQHEKPLSKIQNAPLPPARLKKLQKKCDFSLFCVGGTIVTKIRSKQIPPDGCKRPKHTHTRTQDAIASTHHHSNEHTRRHHLILGVTAAQSALQNKNKRDGPHS